jgi:hypothetical protein
VPTTETGQTPVWKIVVAWAVVMVPFVWGVIRTARPEIRNVGLLMLNRQCTLPLTNQYREVGIAEVIRAVRFLRRSRITGYTEVTLLLDRVAG